MSKAVITYDDSNLQKLFAELGEKERLRAIKGAFRREANVVRKTAIGNLRKGLNSNRDLEDGIWITIFKKKPGFSVSIADKVKKHRYFGKRKGNRRYSSRTHTVQESCKHTNRRGLDLPILIWAEPGTDERHTRQPPSYWDRGHKAHSTGRMPKIGFMETTLEETRDRVTEEIHDEIRKQVTRIAKKYGCK